MKQLLLVFVFGFLALQGEADAGSSHGIYGWQPGNVLAGILSNAQDKRQERILKRKSRRDARQNARNSHGSYGFAPVAAKPKEEKEACSTCTESSCRESRFPSRDGKAMRKRFWLEYNNKKQRAI